MPLSCPLMTMHQKFKLEHESIIPVSELLSETRLRIPDYQRPYKWNSRNITSLLNDIKAQSDKPAYRLGTIVLNSSKDRNNNPVLNIVDGQQRSLTLMLIVLAVAENSLHNNSDNHSNNPANIKSTKATIAKVSDTVKKLATILEFYSDISIYNLHTNFQEISRIVKRGELNIEHIDFLLNKCEVVIFILDDLSEAFQFFDSQNSRGKALYPHDLLKAFHLREFSEYDDEINLNIKAQSVAHWESLEDNELHDLFAKHLFRIKRWIDKKPARHFTSRHVDIFKGLSLHKEGLPHYAKALQALHNVIDEYNKQLRDPTDNQRIDYPFQLDQKIINGRRFFEMVEHYDVLVRQIKSLEDSESISTIGHIQQNESNTVSNHYLDEQAKKIISKLNSYDNKHRQGDKYVRNLFDNTLIYYIDKFGTQDLSLVIRIIFIWAYKVRLERYAVKLATMDNHALEGDFFERIKGATLPKDVWINGVDSLKDSDVATPNKAQDKINAIYQLFDELDYLIRN